MDRTLASAPAGSVDAAGAASRGVVRPAKLLRLDALRGFAVLSIFVYHLWGEAVGWQTYAFVDGRRAFDLWAGRSDWLLYPVTFAWAGVPLFFVLSGFVIHLSFADYQRVGIGTFYRRRFFRIYPAYLLAVLAFAALGARMHQPIGEQLVAHLLLVHNFHPRTYSGLNGSLWSIAVEAQFYALYPLLMALRQRWKITGALAVLAALNLATRVVVLIAEHQPHPISAEWSRVWSTSPLVSWFDWALGAFVAERFASGRPAFSPGVRRWGGLACVVAFVVGTSFESTDRYAFDVAAVGFAFAIDQVAHADLRPRFVERLLVPLGIVGYSFYLWHQPLIGVCWRRLNALHLTHAYAVPLAVALTFAAIFLVSSLLYRLVELPAMRLGRTRRPAVEMLTPA